MFDREEKDEKKLLEKVMEARFRDSLSSGETSFSVRTDASEWAWNSIRKWIKNNPRTYAKTLEINSSDYHGFLLELEQVLDNIKEPLKTVNSFSEYCVFMANDSFLVYFNVDEFSKKIYTYIASNSRETLENVAQNIRDRVGFKEPIIQWYYKTSNGISYANVPLKNENVIQDSFYPYIKEGVKAYSENYIDSSAAVLILLGEPGTGKTSFIRNFISEFARNAVVTYDENVLNSDRFLIDFLTDQEKDTLVVEDADLLLASRNKDMNKHMNKFLNISDGLIKLPNKKIIFSTNLRSPDDIDSALTRPGRCFDVLEFRGLTFEEAYVINPDVDKHAREYSLANVFNGKDNVEKKRKVGFV